MIKDGGCGLISSSTKFSNKTPSGGHIRGMMGSCGT